VIVAVVFLRHALRARAGHRDVRPAPLAARCGGRGQKRRDAPRGIKPGPTASLGELTTAGLEGIAVEPETRAARFGQRRSLLLLVVLAERQTDVRGALAITRTRRCPSRRMTHVC
jgi:hypothetical protein